MRLARLRSCGRPYPMPDERARRARPQVREGRNLPAEFGKSAEGERGGHRASPTAPATRLAQLWRTSPAAKTRTAGLQAGQPAASVRTPSDRTPLGVRLRTVGPQPVEPCSDRRTLAPA